MNDNEQSSRCAKRGRKFSSLVSVPIRQSESGRYFFGILLAVKARTLLVFFILFLALALMHAGGRGFPRPANEEEAVLSLGERSFSVSVADTAAEQIRGLSGRSRLGADEGMLFVFPRSERHGFWMKEMVFPIDIMWLNDGEPQTDAEGRRRLVVVDIKENVLPETFPEVFYPREKAQYALEAKAGTVRGSDIRVGDRAVFR